MSDIPTSSTEKPALSFGARWGLKLRYGLDVPIPTAISEPGLGHNLGLHLEIAEGDLLTLGADVGWAKTDGKLLPFASGPGATYDHIHWSGQFGFGRWSRTPFWREDENHSARGSLSAWGSFSRGAIPSIGVGSSSFSRSPVTLGGESFSFGSTSQTTFDVNTTYALALGFRLGRRFPEISIGPAFALGAQYAGEGSEFNRLKLSFMLLLSLGSSDILEKKNAGAQKSGAVPEDMEMGALGIAQGLFALAQSWLQRLMINATLARPQQIVQDYGLLAPDPGNRGAMANVPFFEAASNVGAAIGGSLTPALHAGNGWYWGFLGARTLGEILFLLPDNDAARVSAGANLLGSGRLLLYPIFGIHAPARRASLPSLQIERREMVIDLIGMGLHTILFAGGAIAGSANTMQTAALADAQVAADPNPSGRKTIERSDYTYGIDFLFGRTSGIRGSIGIHKDWHDFPLPNFQLFSALGLSSPSIWLGNIGNHVSQSGPYRDGELSSDVDAKFGLAWKTSHTRLAFGTASRAIFGDPEVKAAFGGNASFDVLIPFSGREDGHGITLGAKCLFLKLFPEGFQGDCSLNLGVTLGSAPLFK